MNVKIVKEFVKEHKKGIIIGCASVAAAVAFKLVFNPKFFSVSTDASCGADFDQLFEMATAQDQMKEGATAYIGWKADQDAAMFGDNIYAAPDGNTLKVTGAILFGNRVEA